MMPWATHVTLGAGHVPFFDDPAAVAEVIRSSAHNAAAAGTADLAQHLVERAASGGGRPRGGPVTVLGPRGLNVASTSPNPRSTCNESNYTSPARRPQLAAGTLAAVYRAGPSALAAGTDHTVFVQTDNIKGNQVVAYDRGAGGTLTQAGTYNTGGLGGALKVGRRPPRLAGLARYDSDNGLLYAVNAGSNTISVFAVNPRPARAAPGDRLGRNVPGQHRRPRRRRVRAQRTKGGALQGYSVRPAGSSRSRGRIGRWA